MSTDSRFAQPTPFARLLYAHAVMVCGDAALYCDPLSVDAIAQGLETLLCDEVSRARLAHAGPTHAKSFRWDDAARATADVIAPMLP